MSFVHNKSFLENFIINYQREFSKPDHEFNFRGVFGQAAVIFMGNIKLQEELYSKQAFFEKIFSMHIVDAQSRIKEVRLGQSFGIKRGKYFDEDEGFVKVDIPITAMENHLWNIRNWVDKQIAIISADLGLNFENIESFELENAG